MKSIFFCAVLLLMPSFCFAQVCTNCPQQVVSQQIVYETVQVPKYVNVVERMSVAVPKTTMETRTRKVPVTTYVEEEYQVAVTSYECQTVDVCKQYAYGSQPVGNVDVVCVIRAAQVFASARSAGATRIGASVQAGREYLTCSSNFSGAGSRRVGFFRSWRAGRRLKRRNATYQAQVAMY